MSKQYIFDHVKADSPVHLRRSAAMLFIRDLYRTYSAGSYPDPQDLDDQLVGQTNRRSLFVVLNHGRVVGAATAVIEPAKQIATIKEFVTDHSYRGKGIGRMLMLGLANAVAEAGCSTVDVLADASAISFYMRLGFEPVLPRVPHILHAPVETLLQQCPPEQDSIAS